MRRSSAPSQNSNPESTVSLVLDSKRKAQLDRTQPKQNPVVSLDSDEPDLLPNLPQSCMDLDTVDYSTPRYFSVVWGKLSNRKHKKWEGDAVLTVKGRCATLVDLEGKAMARNSAFQLKRLLDLEDGSRLVMSGKEIEIQNEISEEQAMEIMQQGSFSSSTNESDSKPQPSVRPFVQPLRDENGATKRRRLDNCGGLFSPDAHDALVMPQPDEKHQQSYNTHGLTVTPVVVDPRLSTHLRSHQREGVTFLYECVMGMRSEGRGAILADDMGLGKSLQCISLIWTLLKQGPYGTKSTINKVLLVCPCSLVQNWLTEFNKWLGDERLKVLCVSKPGDLRTFASSWRYNPVLIISYEMAMRCEEQLKEISFGLLVCDEGHRLKNANIKTTQALNSLEIPRRILLTGTPIQNDLQELYALVDFVCPGLFGSSSFFRDKFEQPIVAGQQPTATRTERSIADQQLGKLRNLTAQCMLRRSSELNQKYLPPKYDYTLFCAPSDLQLELYEQLLNTRELQSILDKCFNAQHLAVIDALKKLCNHPVLVYQSIQKQKDQMSNFYHEMADYFPPNFMQEGATVEHSGKLTVLCDLLENVRVEHPSDKLVVVSNYTKTLNMIGDLCGAFGFRTLRLDGQTPAAERQRLVKQFNNPNDTTNVFLLSSKAGGVGLNLIGANRLVLFDVDWNPANDLQAMSRIWRDGQKQTCYIYRLLTTGTIDEKMFQRQIKKQALAGAVVDSHLISEDLVKPKFSQEELRDLFTLHRDTECQTHDLFCACSGAGDMEEQSNKRIQTTQDKDGSAAEKNVCSWRHFKNGSSRPRDGDCLSSLLSDSSGSLTFLFENFSGTKEEPNE